MPDWAFETGVAGPVAGVDEAGRGPLAGPVVAAAVMIDRQRLPAEMIPAIDDSKKLCAAKRLAIFERLPAFAAIGVGQASIAEIDSLNILHAAMLAMRRAVSALPSRPGLALIDGNRIPNGLPCPAQAVIGGDGLSVSIAAASIIAKVTRDRLMTDLASHYPGYGWEHNAGYGTPEHLAALARLGPTDQHRRGFRPIFTLLQGVATESQQLILSTPITL